MVDSETNFVLEGEARCARAFCLSCSTTIVSKACDPAIGRVTCPFHLLQGSRSDLIAGEGPSDKSLDDNALPSVDADASPKEPDPSSDGVESL